MGREFLFFFLIPVRIKEETEMEPTAVSVFVPYFLLSIGERKDVSDSSWPKHFTEVKFPRRMESLGHKPLH